MGLYDYVFQVCYWAICHAQAAIDFIAADIFDGLTWVHVFNSLLIIVVSYAAVDYASCIAVRVLNYFLLRSFAAVSRDWCFVDPPDTITKLERLEGQMKMFFYILTLLMRWPGWKEFEFDLWQCAVRGAIGFVALNAILVALMVLTDTFIRSGHYLATLLGWHPEPDVLWDDGHMTVATGYAFGSNPTMQRGTVPSYPTRIQGAARLPDTATAPRQLTPRNQEYRSDLGQLNVNIPVAGSFASPALSGMPSPVSPSSAASSTLSLNNNARRSLPWMHGLSPITWFSPRTPRHAAAEERASGQFATSLDSSTLDIDPSISGVSTELRRRFT